MSEEICKNCKYHYTAEISFDYPQSCCNKTNPNHTTEEWLHCDCFEYNKKYITNLQQKVEQLEKKNKELKQPQVFIDCEDMEERYARDLYEDYLKEKIEQLENIRKEAIWYLTSYESISTIQGLDDMGKNKNLDEKTMNEMINRYLKVHDILLNILNKGSE